MIRDLNLHDLVILEKNAQFPMPNLTSHLYLIKKSIEIDHCLLGSFWTKLTSETSLIFEKELNPLTRARVIKEIFDYLYLELQKFGLDDSHLFIEDDEHYVELLKKHFHFKDNLGHALYIGRNGRG